MFYKHLTLTDRICLGELKKKGLSVRAMAEQMGCSPSTVSRELKKNSVKNGYIPNLAHAVAMKRWHKAKSSSLQKDPEKKAYAIEKLKNFWSPETIAGTWAKEHPGSTLSASTIYRHIERGWLPEISKKEHLRRRGKRKIHRKSNYNTIHPDRLITEWPEEIQKRLRIGDLEGDTIVGAPGKGAIVTLVDRKSGMIWARVIHHKDAETTLEAMMAALKDVPVRTISLDNGSEFAKFHELEQRLNVLVYFAEPHKPWQRGSNENANGLLRFFFPKGSDFTQVTQEELDAVLELINSRPRKRFNWCSPLDLFSVALA